MPSKPIAILCSVDHKRFFFAIATDEAVASPLLTGLQSDDAEVWIPVTLDDFYEFSNPDRGDQIELFADVVVYGEKIADWTKATIESSDM